MSTPTRIQLSRRKGWRMPPNTVNVARPGRFGNPFLVTEDRSQAEALQAFRTWLTTGADAGMPDRKWAILNALPELRGKNLACWCKPGDSCHAEVLLALANGDLEPRP